MGANNLSIIDLFCGTGGFSQGFLNFSTRFALKYAIDLDASASETARRNHPGILVETNDIRSVSPQSVQSAIRRKRVDVVIGGPPCQGFSSLRPNRSNKREDDRNNLYLRFAQFVEAFRPKVVVLENVVGLLTHQGGRTLDQLLESFTKLGYSVDWRILNAASYGVPQKRERFIMIAARDNRAVHFPSPTHFFDGKVIGFKDRSRYLLGGSGLLRAVSVEDAIGELPQLERGQELVCYDQDPKNDYQRARRARAKSLTLHRAANHSDRMLEVIKHAGPNISSIPKHLISSGFSSCYSRLSASEPSTTITVKFQSPASNKCIHPTQHRTITPREAARLQSFDDDYLFVGPYTEIASQIGNAVPPLLGSAIAATVLSMLN
ncbi:DNA cytosine methyltransferase [Gemmatimonas phototrophica]|uniref:DNA cytosine methyltransferase n=1 Tax=Gemmatimonas phototrophica TaxID=1379270 RepID=UPI00193113CE|nr:DNA cytosine methyltransferase [Gemmatimonas phototrophica]